MVRTNGHTLVTVAGRIRLRDLRKGRNMVRANVYALYAGETGHSHGIPMPHERNRVSSLDVDICRRTDAHLRAQIHIYRFMNTNISEVKR